jgi:hypothetical protein
MNHAYKGIFDFTVARPYEIATPLPPTDSFAGTPAMQALESGLGAYLLEQGFECTHPLVFQDEQADPYCYVIFSSFDDWQSYQEHIFLLLQNSSTAHPNIL